MTPPISVPDLRSRPSLAVRSRERTREASGGCRRSTAFASDSPASVFQRASGTPPRMERKPLKSHLEMLHWWRSRSVPSGTPLPLAFSLFHQSSRGDFVGVRFRLGLRRFRAPRSDPEFVEGRPGKVPYF